MEALTIIECKPHNIYVLQNGSKQNFKLGFEFFGTDKPKVEDKILISNELLDKRSKNFCIPYAFEKTTEFTPQQIKELNNPEFIVLRTNNKNIGFKRIYG